MYLIESITVKTIDPTKKIVSGLIDEIGIVEVINQKLGVDNREKITAGIKQRWLIVESAERQQSDIQKLNSKIEQEKKTVLKLAKKIINNWI